jgi:glycosyltransferase involved in cell wall biosynthesis
MLEAAALPIQAGRVAVVGAAPPELNVLQLGMGWFAEQAGGSNRMYYGLMQHFPAVGVQAEGVVAGRPARMPVTPRISSFAPHEAPLHARLWRAHRLARSRDFAGCQLVATHFALYTLPMLEALRGLPLVVHFHGPWASEGAVEGDRPMVTRAKKWVESRVYARASRFIVLSRAFREVLERDYGVPAALIDIVPGGVDCRQFARPLSQREARLQLDLPPDRPIVFCVRRLAPRMGLRALIEAVEDVRRAVPNVLVLIAGKGSLAAELGARIRELSLEDHVRLLGFVPDDILPVFYRASNLSIVPTECLEGFGLVAAESLAAGTPVLVTPSGGLPEVVEDLSKDLILPGCGRNVIAAGLIDALRGRIQLPDADRCQAFAARFDWRRIAAQTADIYRAVLAQTARLH